MRISDWSSDVCSSDLTPAISSLLMLTCAMRPYRTSAMEGGISIARVPEIATTPEARRLSYLWRIIAGMLVPDKVAAAAVEDPDKIGRASCRERVCQYV